MSRVLLSGNAAVAWGARLAGVDYVPAFPITPQTEIIETLAGWIGSGELDARSVILRAVDDRCACLDTKAHSVGPAIVSSSALRAMLL